MLTFFSSRRPNSPLRETTPARVPVGPMPSFPRTNYDGQPACEADFVVLSRRVETQLQFAARVASREWEKTAAAGVDMDGDLFKLAVLDKVIEVCVIPTLCASCRGWAAANPRVLARRDTQAPYDTYDEWRSWVDQEALKVLDAVSERSEES